MTLLEQLQTHSGGLIKLKPGDLVRLKENVYNAGVYGIILKNAPESWSAGIYEVMYKDGIRMCHVDNVDVINEVR